MAAPQIPSQSRSHLSDKLQQHHLSVQAQTRAHRSKHLHLPTVPRIIQNFGGILEMEQVFYPAMVIQSIQLPIQIQEQKPLFLKLKAVQAVLAFLA